VPGAEAMEELARPCGLARDLAQAFWPGPLTLVLPKKQVIPDLITAGQPTVALRCSAHPLFQQVVIRCGFPLAAPSANRFGRISPTTAAAVVEELDGRIGWLADGGACGHGVESTIVAVGEKELRILRPGPVGEKELAAFAPLREAAAGESAPGRLPWHYAPQTTLRILPGGGMAEVPTGARKGLLAWSKPPPDGDWAAIEHLSLTGGNMVEAAHRLYECLRRLDAAGLEILWAEPLPDEGLGRVIMDRLRKAAARG
jgi:L-threonylcarbamoyladenylate synthase